MANDVRSKVVLGIDVNEFRRGITQVDSSIKGISKQFQNLGGIIGASFAVSQIQAFTSEALDLAMKAQGIETAFNRIGNEINMDNLRKAVQGTVSDLELMRQAVTAEKLGIPIQEFTKYLGFAKKQANEMGESVDYMVDSIVKGVGRQSTMILDNLGISAKAVQEELKKGGTFAEAVGRIIQQEMGGANDTLLTTQDRLLQQKANLENIKKELGERLLPVYEAVLGFVNDSLRQINRLFGDQLTFFEKLAYYASYLDFTGGELKRIAIEAEAAGRAAAALGDMTEKVGEETEDAADSAKKLADELKKIAGIKVQGGLRLADVEPGLAPKGTAVTPLYQTDMALFGIRKQAEYAAGSWDVYTAAQSAAAGKSSEWVMKNQDVAAQLEAITAIGAQFGQVFQASFQAAIINGQSFFDSVRAGMKAYVQQMAAATAATLTLAAAMAIIFPNVGFKAAFNVLGGGMGLPFGFGGDEMQLGLRIAGNDFYTGIDRNTNRNARIGG